MPRIRADALRMNCKACLLGWMMAAGGIVLVRGAEPWSEVRLGMTAEQATALLGKPLLRSGGFGFEIWTYDRCGEVVFYGPLVAWTEPAAAGKVGRSVDVWQKDSAPGETAAFFLPRPEKTQRLPARTNRAPTAAGSSAEATWLPRYRPRARF